MGKHHIFCIHGIGKHDNDWVKTEEESGETFEELFKKLYKEYVSDDFDKEVELHSIHYDDEINKIFASWEEYSNNLKKNLSPSPIFLKEVEWFTKEFDSISENKNNFIYTHLFDLLIFSGSKTLRKRLVTYVGKQILEIIKKYGVKENYSIIAHSMGTAMAHDIIEKLYSETITLDDGKSKQTLKGDFKFESVSMVANTSYTLSKEKDKFYETIVRPSKNPKKGCANKWFNVNHMLDPVGQYLPFDYEKNQNWLDPRIKSKGRYKDIKLTAISSKNIHSLNHYFRDPCYHIPFFQLNFSDKFDSKKFNSKKIKKICKEFEENTPIGKIKSIKSNFEDLNRLKIDSFKTFFKSIKKFLKLIEDISKGEEA